MLGHILGGLTDPTAAAAVLAAVADAGLLERVLAAADEHGVDPGAVVAQTVRHVIDHDDEALWLDLVGKMAASAQPGAAALQAILAYAFPAPGRGRPQ